jgi:hypothetical protein
MGAPSIPRPLRNGWVAFLFVIPTGNLLLHFMGAPSIPRPVRNGWVAFCLSFPQGICFCILWVPHPFRVLCGMGGLLFVCHSRRESASAFYGCPIHSASCAEWVGCFLFVIPAGNLLLYFAGAPSIPRPLRNGWVAFLFVIPTGNLLLHFMGAPSIPRPVRNGWVAFCLSFPQGICFCILWVPHSFRVLCGMSGLLFVCHSRRESASAFYGCPIHSASFAEWVGLRVLGAPSIPRPVRNGWVYGCWVPHSCAFYAHEWESPHL